MRRFALAALDFGAFFLVGAGILAGGGWLLISGLHLLAYGIQETAVERGFERVRVGMTVAEFAREFDPPVEVSSRPQWDTGSSMRNGKVSIWEPRTGDSLLCLVVRDGRVAAMYTQSELDQAQLIGLGKCLAQVQLGMAIDEVVPSFAAYDVRRQVEEFVESDLSGSAAKYADFSGTFSATDQRAWFVTYDATFKFDHGRLVQKWGALWDQD